MEALATQHPDVKLRRVDVVSWESPVAAQYEVRRLPTIWLYENGSLVARDRDALERLSRLR